MKYGNPGRVVRHRLSVRGGLWQREIKSRGHYYAGERYGWMSCAIAYRLPPINY